MDSSQDLEPLEWASIDEQIKMWGVGTHTGILLSHKKSNSAMYSSMYGPRHYYSKKSERKKHMVSLTCGS